MSEISTTPKEVSQALHELLETLKPILGGKGNVAFYEEIAKRLSTVVKKDPAWGWRYVKSVETGTVEPSRKFTRAVFALGATLDGVPKSVVDTVPVQVYAPPGAVRPGSIILSESKTCARPGCTANFVPRVPWQKYCSLDCRRTTSS